MNLEDAIKKALDGKGVLFLGSGFSYGGKNSKGDNLKLGSQLSHAICNQIKIENTDDLTISSERYLQDPLYKKTLVEFIEFLKSEIICHQTSTSQNIISSLPWKRIYTTNYDNSFEVASQKNNIIRSSITITNKRYISGQNLDQAIIHINGSILTVDENNFYDEFKISDSTYNKSGLLDSTWKELFDSDMISAETIFFIGYSLQYDQELVRHMTNLNIKDKCIFIDIETISSDNEFRIGQHGSLYKIGTNGLSSHIEQIQKDYTPKPSTYELQGFTPRIREDYYSETKYTPFDIMKLYISGKFKTKFVNQPGYCFKRKKRINEVEELLRTKDIIVIESKLGNGKSTFLECLANHLLNFYDIYFVNNLDTMNDDLNYIFKHSNKTIILLIDDYGNYLPLLKSLGNACPENIKLILTSRSVINSNLFYDLYEKYGFNYETIALLNIDLLTNSEITEIVNNLNINRLWGKYDTLSIGQKKKIIRKEYRAEISNLFYLFMNSKPIKESIEQVLIDIKNSTGLFDLVLAQTINNICNLKFSYNDLLEFTGISDTLLRSHLGSKPRAKEVFDEREHKFILNSSIYSKYLVKEADMHSHVLDMLKKIFEKCSVNDELRGKYLQQRRIMVSRSNILLLVQGSNNNILTEERAILLYFDSIKHFPTATNNPFFWLQYGITAINLNEFDLAFNNFENAYANANMLNDFDTFQIDTHKARLLLCAEMKKNSNNRYSAMNTFRDAHNLLYNNKNRGERLRYVLRQVDEYNKYYTYYKTIFQETDRKEFLALAFDMLEKYKQYFTIVNSEKIPPEIEKSYINFYNLFKNTPYVIEFIEINRLFNQKVSHKRFKIK